MTENEEEFEYPRIDGTLCIRCYPCLSIYSFGL
ncbi:hypothetical protein [Blautia sp.]